MAIEVGQEAPDFTLRNPDDEDVTLSSFRGRRNVVLVFYTLAFSEVCTVQLTQVRGSTDRYADSDAQVIGISVDSRYVQGRFARELGLTDAVLLADFEPKGMVSRAYGVYREENGFSGRATFVIDKEGIVQGVSLTEHPGLMQDQEQYFAALSVCAT
jgi:peroxiredoxin (alkyl hydroperoxide reductase subunit C)